MSGYFFAFVCSLAWPGLSIAFFHAFSGFCSFSTGFTDSVIESGGLFYSFCNKVFASWDYCITSEKAADLKKKNIHQDIQVSYIL